MVARLASLVEDAVPRLEAPAEHRVPDDILPACIAALDACIASLRDLGGRDEHARAATDNLHRLGRILKLVDGADAAFVMRQIRRALGRLDASGDAVDARRR